MSDDLFSLFESKLQDIGLSDHNTVLEIHPIELEMNNTNVLSFAEERAWMLHQQDPLASSGPFLVGIKLSGEINFNRLIQSIKKLYSADSNLNLRYVLDEEGLLTKFHENSQEVDVNIRLVHSDEEAIQHLLTLIRQPIDLGKDAAIQFILMPKNNQEVIVGILGHHILLDDTGWKPIFSHLSHYYNDENIPLVSTQKFKKTAIVQESALQYWKDTYPTGLEQLSWPTFFLRAESVETAISEYGKALIFDIKPKAIRSFTTISSTQLQDLSEQSQSSLFHTVVALFGFYLNAILDLKSIDLFVPIVEQYDASILSEIKSSSNILPIRIERLKETVKTQITEVRNQILEGMSQNVSIEQILSATKTKRSSIPNVLVTQFIEGNQYLSLSNVVAESLSIPPIHSDYDLTLAFQIKDNETLQLELTTGEKLSKSVGTLLLEQFVIFLHQDFKQAVLYSTAFGSKLQDDQPQQIDSLNSSNDENKEMVAQSINQPLTQIILDEFKAVLMNPNLVADDNFFDHGGHSILATRVIGKLQSQHGLAIKIADFFNAPTAIELTEYVAYLNQNKEEVKTFAEDEEIVAPLTLLQKAFMGFSDQGRDSMYNIPFAFRFSEQVNEQAFYQAFVDILERHHALRTIFIQGNAQEYFQTVIPLKEISDYPWFWSSENQDQQLAQDILRQEANHRFELTEQFPIRVRFVKDEQGRHILSLLLYHIAMDEWSSDILMRELIQAYISRLAAKAPIWEKIPRQFHEYALAQDDSILQDHLDYWIESIGKVKKCPPLLRTQNDLQNLDVDENVEGSSVEFSFCAEEVSALYELAKQCKSSSFYVVYAAIVLAIYYLGAGKKILTGTSVACRNDPDYQDTVGYFTNVVMHYTQFKEDLSVKELVNQVQNNIFKTLDYADIPFAIVEENIRAADEKSTDSPYEVYIQLHAKNALTGSFQLQNGHDIGFELLEPERDTAKFGLHFEVYEEPLSDENRLRVVINYRVNRYNQNQIILIKEVIQQVIASFIHADVNTGINVMNIRQQLAEINFQDNVM